MTTDDPQLADRRNKLDHLESFYQGPMPGLDQVDREIVNARHTLTGALQVMNHANPAQQLVAKLLVGSISRMIDWFLSFVVPIP